MIIYRCEDELSYAIYYAKKLGDELVVQILDAGEVRDVEQAKRLSKFFWLMVDASVEDEHNNLRFPGHQGAEFMNYELMNSFGGHLERIGYLYIWDEESDRQ